MNTKKTLEFYMLGFTNELNIDNVPKEFESAYKLGRKHALAGDKIETTEFLTDEIVEYLIEKDKII
jgi:hypothetical protein